MNFVSAKEHYDLLIQEENDPVNDSPILQKHMDKWDGKTFIDALSLTPRSHVLEIGVGTGRLAKKVLERGCFSFTGIDISPATIDRAKLHLRSWNNVLLITDDFLNHSFQSKFDAVYCSLTFFHFKGKKATVNKVVQILNKTGLFVLSISVAKENVINYDTRQVLLYPDDLEETKNLFTICGLKVLRVINTEFANIIVAQKI
jgi:ubiquinone/menaquinone biosynthesis C-methylase UbiE